MTTQVEITKDERLRILRELPTKKCFCGAKKREHNTFCPRHYYALPKPMRDALYDGFGDGYEEAYTKAREYFNANQ